MPPRKKPAETPAEHKKLSISALAMHFDLDRATVKKYIAKADIEPVETAEKKVLYVLTPELEEALSQDGGDLDAEKLRKLSAEADLKEYEAKIKRGELASVAEFKEVLQQIVGAMHTKLAIQMPDLLSTRVIKCKTKAEAKQIIGSHVDRVFADVRTNHRKFLSGE